MRPDELAREAGLRVPDEGPFETLGGFIMMSLGRLPRVGDEVVGEDVVLTVEELDGRRVSSVRARAIEQGEDE